ncbi:alpha/beta fold hydrolase [Candidatus Woesebacteria bacterium]|nr:alpha/beta fold hydrolase [Candidatus Woesebacteria bacterium]
MKKQEIWINSDNHRLFLLLETPNNHKSELILLLHGLTNSLQDCPLIEDVAKKLHKNRFATLRFDYFGSGKSDGELKDKTLKILYKNTLDVLAFANNDIKFTSIGIWGRSVGGMLASSVCDHKSVSASVIVSSTVRSNESFGSLFDKRRLYSKPIQGSGEIKGKPVLTYEFYKQTTWFDNLQKKHLSQAKNTLVIQGTDDKIIHNSEWPKEIYSLIKGKKRLEMIEGADHTYKGYEDEVVKKAVNWFLESSKNKP